MTKTVTTAILTSLVALCCASPILAQESAELEAMIAAAKGEPPITVYAVTGKIVETAQAFTAKYGVIAEGKKVSEADQIELLLREHQAGNSTGDVTVAADVAAVMGQLVPEGVVENFVPPDLAANIAAPLQDPLVLVTDPHVWTYNTEVYETCPVSNIWQLTEPEWSRKVAMLDPLVKPAYADWFNQLETNHDAEMASAYEALYGKPLVTDEKSATAAWVKAYAENQPLVADSSAVADAIGAPGQAEPYFGISSVAKYRDNTEKGYRLGICSGMQPFAGWLYPGFGMVAAGTDSPNAARLFIHYLLTEEGIAPQTIDGKISSNSAIAPNPEEASGVAAVMGEMMAYDTTTAKLDFELRQDWQDFWRIHYSR
jgi:iron(III) transport system substrate-binding protein